MLAVVQGPQVTFWTSPPFRRFLVIPLGSPHGFLWFLIGLSGFPLCSTLSGMSFVGFPSGTPSSEQPPELHRFERPLSLLRFLRFATLAGSRVALEHCFDTGSGEVAFQFLGAPSPLRSFVY